MAVQPMETSQRQFLFDFEFYFPMVSDFDRADATISQLACDRQRQEASEKKNKENASETKYLHNDCAAMRFKSQMKCEIDALHNERCTVHALRPTHSDRQIGYRAGVNRSVSCDSVNMIKRRMAMKMKRETDRAKGRGGGRERERKR